MVSSRSKLRKYKKYKRNFKSKRTTIHTNTKKNNKGLLYKIKKSPINYFSDLFIIVMVMFWIIDNVYESIIASVVTISSVIISINTNTACYDTSMWSSIGTSVAIPLASGGAIWMIKNSVQHAIANKKGKKADMDFPDTETGDITLEQPNNPEEG